MDGIWLPSNHVLVSDVIKNHIDEGIYEWHERTVLRKLLKPTDTVLELGTGIGFLATWCAKRCRFVVTVEANRALIPLIQQTFKQNEVTPALIPLGVSKLGNAQQLLDDPHFWAVQAVPGNDQPSMRFDSLLSMVHPDVLLVDIEGSELELCHTPLTGVRAVVIEVHGDKCEASVRRWLTYEGFREVARSTNVIGWER